MEEKSWSELLAEHSPELAQISRADGEFLDADSALPAWVKQLMAMQMDAVFNHPHGARWYGRRARELGASREQVVEAIKLLRIFGGRPAMATGAEGLREPSE
ncbi:MAG: carboxymuconolactone decarboxylase family protein [Anaerolineae bacterium]|nr:carboxymuconolactone decarboxylase family protein [Anaerolineae bacterium]